MITQQVMIQLFFKKKAFEALLISFHSIKQGKKYDSIGIEGIRATPMVWQNRVGKSCDLPSA